MGRKFVFTSKSPKFLRNRRREPLTRYFEDIYYDNCEEDLNHFLDTLFSNPMIDDKRNVRVVSGSYGSGKTMFATLLQDRLRYEQVEGKSYGIGAMMNAIYFGSIEELVDHFLKKVNRNRIEDGKTSFESIEKALKEMKDNGGYIIIDEYQAISQSVSVRKVYKQFFSMCQGESILRFVIGAEPENLEKGTKESHFNISETLYIPYMKKKNLESMIREYNQENEMKLSDDFVDRLFEITNGHRGYIGAILYGITNVDESEYLRVRGFGLNGYSVIPDEIIQDDEEVIRVTQYCRMKSAVSQLFSTSQGRIEVNGETLTISEICGRFPFFLHGHNDLDELLRGNTQNPALREKAMSVHNLAVRHGLLVVRKEKDEETGRVRRYSKISCRVARKIFLYEYSSRSIDVYDQGAIFPSTEDQDKDLLYGYIKNSIGYMDRDVLCYKETFFSNGTGKKKNCPKECVFQTEFYRSMYSGVKLMNKNEQRGNVQWKVLFEANLKRLFCLQGKEEQYEKLSQSLVRKKLVKDKKSLSQRRIDLVLVKEVEEEIEEVHIFELVAGERIKKREINEMMGYSSVEGHWIRNEELYSKIPNTKSHCVIAFYGEKQEVGWLYNPFVVKSRMNDEDEEGEESDIIKNMVYFFPQRTWNSEDCAIVRMKEGEEVEESILSIKKSTLPSRNRTGVTGVLIPDDERCCMYLYDHESPNVCKKFEVSVTEFVGAMDIDEGEDEKEKEDPEEKSVSIFLAAKCLEKTLQKHVGSGWDYKKCKGTQFVVFEGSLQIPDSDSYQIIENKKLYQSFGAFRKCIVTTKPYVPKHDSGDLKRFCEDLIFSIRNSTITEEGKGSKSIEDMKCNCVSYLDYLLKFFRDSMDDDDEDNSGGKVVSASSSVEEGEEEEESEGEDVVIQENTSEEKEENSNNNKMLESYIEEVEKHHQKKFSFVRRYVLEMKQQFHSYSLKDIFTKQELLAASNSDTSAVFHTPCCFVSNDGGIVYVADVERLKKLTNFFSHLFEPQYPHGEWKLFDETGVVSIEDFGFGQLRNLIHIIHCGVPFDPISVDTLFSDLTHIMLHCSIYEEENLVVGCGKLLDEHVLKVYGKDENFSPKKENEKKSDTLVLKIMESSQYLLYLRKPILEGIFFPLLRKWGTVCLEKTKKKTSKLSNFDHVVRLLHRLDTFFREEEENDGICFAGDGERKRNFSMTLVEEELSGSVVSKKRKVLMEL